MRERIVGIGKDNRAEGYIADCLSEKEIDFEKECDNSFVYFRIYDPEDTVESLVSDVIVTYYKFGEIYRLLIPDGVCTYPYCAYIGSVMSIDADLERRQIKSLIPSDKMINIDGIYNFCLPKIRESWESLAILCKKLVAQCKTEKDMYSLTSFMLGVENDTESTLTVDRQEKITLKKNGQQINLPILFGNPEMDAIATILANSPSEIVILKKEAFSEEFMDLMRKIGI
ncbi:MAG TPA: hypothetical protein PKY53_03820 [Clostridia bacterium]|nr:hypothetical protein [Clostridia bacterium]